MSQSHLKKGAAAILAGVLSVSSVVPAFAAVPGDTENYDHITTAGNVGNAAVTLTVEDREQPVIFSAYVPAELPIAIDANGDVTVPQNAKIINGVETLPIEVEAIDVTMDNGWELTSMDTDMSLEAKDTKKIAMEVLGQDLSDADSFSPAKIEANGELPLGMQAKLPDQSASSQTKIATIGFTVNWWENQDSTPELNATNELSKVYMDRVLKSLTGSIVFSTEMYDPEQHAGTATDISKERDGSVMAVVNGQDAVVYSEGGTLAPEDCSYLFDSYKASSMDLHGLDTSQVISMQNMFKSLKATSLNLSSFNTSNVTNMRYMFYQSAAIELDLSSFDTSKVTDMYAMFASSKATSLDLSSFNTSKVTNMGSMFQRLAVTSLDLSSFDTSQVTNMENMFSDLSATNLDLSSFDTSNVTSMYGMFARSKTPSLDLSSFDMSQVSNTEYMFQKHTDTSVLCRSEADAAIMKKSYQCPSTVNFVVKQ